MEEKTDSEKYKEWKESSMERHDLYNFESKVNYSLEPTKKNKTSYFLDAYIFIPRALNINKDTYTKEQFYSEINNRIRFKTPRMSIEGILDEKNLLSPINTILENIKLIEYGKISKKITTKIHREIRLLACILKVTLRDQFKYYLGNYDSLKKVHDISELLSSYLVDIKELRKRINSIGEQFLRVQIPLKLRESLQFADEYISLQIEEWLTLSLKVFENEFNSQLREKSISIIEAEQAHRKNIKSRLLVKEDSNNEDFSFWEGVLKKYIQSVLYLDRKKKDPKSTSLEALYSVAAGAAMFFSLFFGFLIISAFEMYSVAFIIATVVLYMLKDRIKDNIRSISNKAVGLFYPDQRIDIVDGFNEEKIGECKEKVYFTNKEKIPPEILKIRRASSQSPIEQKGKPEEILLYQKKITLFNKSIEEYHKRRRDISDVTRFNVREFRRYADDPIQFGLKWNKDTRKVEKVPISKVYHINVIFKLTSFKDKKAKDISYKKFRVILDQNGIKRILEPEILL